MSIAQGLSLNAADFNALKQRIINECNPDSPNNRRSGISVDSNLASIGQAAEASLANSLINPMQIINTSITNTDTIISGGIIYPLALEAALQTFENAPYYGYSSQCASGCTGLCQGCSGTCQGGCKSNCSGSCSGGCSGGCDGGCRGCEGGCSGGCSGNASSAVSSY